MRGAASRSGHTVVQCDFDDTVTEGDISYLLLDRFAEGDWRRVLDEYVAGHISVGEFNSRVFSMVRVDEQAMLAHLDGRISIRKGFREMISVCRELGFRPVIVSNGLLFYIESILRDLGITDIEVRAARTRYSPRGLEVAYVAPDGTCPPEGLKEHHVTSCLQAGHRVIYIGDGRSDFEPARRCHHIFATRNLLRLCRERRVYCVPFQDFDDITTALRGLRSAQ